MAKNTGDGKKSCMESRNRFQKFNPRTGLWDKYDTRGNYVGSKRTGGAFKSIVKLVGSSPRRP